ncbi:MAG: glycosyltransferase [Anaerolineales bacterium]|nr:glycosyltransferase [Anaerolineales bacterium]
MMLAQTTWFHQQNYPVTAAFFYDKENLHNKWAADYQIPIVNFKGWRFGAPSLINAGRLLGALWRLWRFLREKNIEVIETFTPHSDLVGLPIAWLARVPVRVGCYQGIIHTMPAWQAWIHARLINTAIVTGFVGVSNQMVELAIEAGVQPGNVVMIPNAVNIPDADMEADLRSHRERLRKELGVPDGGVLTITSARLDKEKGHTYFLRAIREIVDSFPKVIFAFAGDGYLRKALEKQADQLGVRDNVRFLGIRFDMLALFRAADIFVLPSLAEGLSLALLEAMTARLPIIATSVQGSKDVVLHEQSGFLVEAANIEALEAAIIRMLNQADRWDAFGQCARDTVLEGYTIDSVCRRYDEYFQGLLGSKVLI